jgi:hypothetical protein
MINPIRETIMKPNLRSLCYALVYRVSATIVVAAAVLIVFTAMWIGELNSPSATAERTASVADRFNRFDPMLSKLSCASHCRDNSLPVSLSLLNKP